MRDLSVGMVVNGWIVPLELLEGQVGETRMRSHGVLVLSRCLDDVLRLASRPEPFDVEALVAELALERFVSRLLKFAVFSPHYAIRRLSMS